MKKLLLILILSFNMFACTGQSALDVLKACYSGNGELCYELGYMYDQGVGVEQDFDNAAEYYEKSCNLYYGLGCDGIGIMYYLGDGVKQDKSKAKKYFEKACALDNGWGCNNLGSEYGALFKTFGMIKSNVIKRLF